MKMSIGTKTILFGSHAFWLHPWFVAWAWTKLYGFPRDWRLWLCFFLHDIGYWGCPNMDGPEGEKHPLEGAAWVGVFVENHYGLEVGDEWSSFCVRHSRFYAEKLGEPVSDLCIADKLACAITPAWLYVPMAMATGEIWEYMYTSKSEEYDPWKWHKKLQDYMHAQVVILQKDRKDVRPREHLNDF